MVSGSAFKFALLTVANFDEIVVPPAAGKRPPLVKSVNQNAFK